MRGFSLIETIIYLALFAILIGGAVVAAFSLFESAGREATHVMLQEEGLFIMGKIEWALGGGGGTVSLSGSDIVLEEGGTASVLNNSNVSVTHLSFVHTKASGNGVTALSIAASTTLAARAPSGAMLSKEFSTVIYFHQ